MSRMTRINADIDPRELMDQHLLAEYRELRLHARNLLRTLKSKHGFQEKKVPVYFTLNTGHCYFFYNKGRFLHKRYKLIQQELRFRGVHADLPYPVENWPQYLYNDWKGSERDRKIARKRIALRISQRPGWYRYCGEIING